MHETLVSDGLWEIIEPLLPPDPPREKGGRSRIPNRNAFAGIVCVLKSGVPCRGQFLMPEKLMDLYNASVDFEKEVKMKLWVLVTTLAALVSCGSGNEEITAPTEDTETIEETTELG